MLSFSNNPAVPKCRYLVSLSDGTTVFEDNLPNLPTTWQRLISHKRVAGHLRINRIRVQCSENLTNIPVGDGYYVFHKEDYGAFSRLLKGVGVFNKQHRRLVVYFFDLQGNLHNIEEREFSEDTPGLILN